MNTLGFIMNQLMRPAMAEHMARQGEPMLEGAAKLFGKEDLSDPATVGVIRDWLEEQGSPMAQTIDQYIVGRPAMVAQYSPNAPLEHIPVRLDQWPLGQSARPQRYTLPWQPLDPMAPNVDGHDFATYMSDPNPLPIGQFQPDLAGYSLAPTGNELLPVMADAQTSLGRNGLGPDLLPKMRGFGIRIGDYGDPRAIPNELADGWVPPAVAVPTHFRRPYID